MVHRLAAVVLMLACATPALAQKGVYEGTGRACAGRLRVSAERVTWRTPFSQCSSPFAMADHRTEGAAERWVHHLAAPQATCLYPVVMVEKRQEPGAPVAWNATGFTSMEAYRSGAAAERLDCYLVKLP